MVAQGPTRRGVSRAHVRSEQCCPHSVPHSVPPIPTLHQGARPAPLSHADSLWEACPPRGHCGHCPVCGPLSGQTGQKVVGLGHPVSGCGTDHVAHRPLAEETGWPDRVAGAPCRVLRSVLCDPHLGAQRGHCQAGGAGQRWRDPSHPCHPPPRTHPSPRAVRRDIERPCARLRVRVPELQARAGRSPLPMHPRPCSRRDRQRPASSPSRAAILALPDAASRRHVGVLQPGGCLLQLLPRTESPPGSPEPLRGHGAACPLPTRGALGGVLPESQGASGRRHGQAETSQLLALGRGEGQADWAFPARPPLRSPPPLQPWASQGPCCPRDQGSILPWEPSGGASTGMARPPHAASRGAVTWELGTWGSVSALPLTVPSSEARGHRPACVAFCP